MADVYNALAGTPVPVSNNALAGQVEIDPYDFTDRYNTKLSPKEEAQFEKWAKKNKRLEDLYDYDLRGFWKEGGEFADNGHGADTYKKPNHPTFSDQSRYHDPKMTPGGTWDEVNGATMFTPSPYNLQMMPSDAMKKYFEKYEPNVVLRIIE